MITDTGPVIITGLGIQTADARPTTPAVMLIPGIVPIIPVIQLDPPAREVTPVPEPWLPEITADGLILIIPEVFQGREHIQIRLQGPK